MVYLKNNWTLEAISIPTCVQVAMYEAGQPRGQYLELVAVYLPFCGIVWCGMDARIVAENGVSLWSCMSTG